MFCGSHVGDSNVFQVLLAVGHVKSSSVVQLLHLPGNPEFCAQSFLHFNSGRQVSKTPGGDLSNLLSAET